MNLQDAPVARRRRGAELEEALLEATWAELSEHGYGALTIDAVAQRAGTSRTVVYRRWATKRELVEAAVVFVGRRDRATVPDTGSLREDMLTLLRTANDRRVAPMALMVVLMGGYFQETGQTPYDLRQLVVDDQTPNAVDVIIERAIERGEVRAETLTPRMRTVAVDLFRHEAVMTLGSVSDETLVGIVDEIYLPLVLAAG